MRRVALFLVMITSTMGSAQKLVPNPTPKQLYERGMNALQGTGTSHDTVKGIDDIRTSALAGYTPAQTALGYFYDNGVYVSGNASEAVRWYKKAAETDDAIGEFGLGRAYYTGSGISRDLNEAMKWLTKAADEGLPQAQYLVGRTLETLDYTAAPNAYRKAAEAGFPLAQYRLGLALASGRGIPIDRAEAYVWLLLSFNAHVEAAETPLSEIQGALGPDATETAKTRAREMESTVTRAANASGCQGWAGELDEIPTVPPPEVRKFCP